MCGISGIVGIEGFVEPEVIQSFTDIISHRGPDDDGFYAYHNVALGHRRLSILDLSPSGHQPMHYNSMLTIVFNGEIYNYIEIREELVKQGYTFSSETDTEVILAAYDLWGEACVEHFNGMWSFALLDKERDILFCSRDRFGVKPFYFRKSDRYFAFGSEIKQFSTLSDWQPTINTARAVDFLAHGIFDHTSETLINDVQQLRGGNNLLYNFKNNSYKVVKWYNLSERVKEYKGSFDDARQEFLELFTDAVTLRLRSDVKVGSCLSGGLDSSSIVCTVNQILRQQNKQDIQETVSACYEEKKYDEQTFIDEVIKSTSVKAHKVFPELEQLNDLLDTLLWHQDEPFSSSSVFAQWCVFEEARKQDLIVMLDGQGADESLAGYPPFHDAYLIGLLRTLSFSEIRKETKALQKLKNYGIKKQWQFLAKYFIPHAIASKITPGKEHFLTANAKSLGTKYRPRFFDSIQEMSLDQLLTSNLPMLLHYEDRNSMAHSVESRVPFLDYRLVEFILSLPDNYKINQGQTKFVLREALSEQLPPAIRSRHDKMGFVTPETIWIKKNADRVRYQLTEAAEALSPIINKDMVVSSFEKMIKEGTDIHIGSIFFRLLTFNRWMERFNVKFEAINGL